MFLKKYLLWGFKLRLKIKKIYKGVYGYDSDWCWDMWKQRFWTGFLSVQASMIDRLCGKTNKNNREDLLFVWILFLYLS